MFQRLAMAVLAILAMVVVPSAAEARARPRMIFPTPLVVPTSMVLLPRGVYFHRAPDVDVFFAGGFWWSPWSGAWYRAESYEGPWELVGPRYVPSDVRYLMPRVPGLLRRAEVIPWDRWRETHRYEHGRRDDRTPGWERRQRAEPHRVDRDRQGGGPNVERDRRGSGPTVARGAPATRGGTRDRNEGRGGGRSGAPQRTTGGHR
jgi:hypothetical protein